MKTLSSCVSFSRCPARLLLALCCVFFSGCLALLDPGPPPSRMQLRPFLPDGAVMQGGTDSRQLVVARPGADDDLDTDRIALIFHGREVKYLADARWTGTAPDLVQRSLVDAFTRSRVFWGVAGEGEGIAGQLRLVCDLREFGLRYADEKTLPTAVFEAVFRLVDVRSGSIAGTVNIRTTAPAAGKKETELARACEQALEKALEEVVLWAAQVSRQAR